jgi:pyruvate kinase
MRRTKIIATLGPASTAPRTFRAVRDAAARAGCHVAILQDLSGPKIRTSRLRGGGPIELRAGEELRLAAGDGEGGPGRIFTPYAELVAYAQPGDRLLLDDGKIELRVRERSGGELVTVVVDGGSLGEHKGINAPGVALPASAVTAKDEEDLRFGLGLGVDMVALSFVQTTEDCHTARRIMRAANADVPLIAKIERPQALEHLDAILGVSDGVMVARGDLGLECPLEQIPRIQKTIIARARALGRPVIVATQVLESMRTEPRPTRAEVSDAATAVDQGVDAIMLAGETAAGQYPVEAVRTLSAVIRDAETVAAPAALVADGVSIFGPHGGDPLPDGFDTFRTVHGRAMCAAAVTLASTGQAEAIVAVTLHGKTAQLLSSLRPRATIVAVTPSESVARRLRLYWGVRPVVSPLEGPGDLEQPVRSAIDLSPRAVVVFININPDLSRQDANFLNVQRLAE